MKKLLPPALFLLSALIMGIVCWAFDFEHYILFPYNLIGLLFLAAGLLLAQMSKRLFLKMKTNVNTFEDPDKLVTSGFYRYSRNPMYLGFLISIIGMAILYQGSVSSFVLAIIFFIAEDRWYVKFEEKAMSKKFGMAFEQYCSNTRRWL